MASLTIRKLDEAIKSYLRMRSAKNGRSVEEEVRVILREYLQGEPTVPPRGAVVGSPAPATLHEEHAGEACPTLVIGGGIAASKALDLIRRLKERHIQMRCLL